MANTRNASPNLMAVGTVYPARFVALSASYDNSCLQATAGQRTIGISQRGTKYPTTNPSGLLGTNQIAAEDQDNLEIYGLGDICPLELGASVTRGDLLESDSNGKGITAKTSVAVGRNVGAIALESGTSGQVVLVQIVQIVSGQIVTSTATTDTATITAAQLLTGWLQATPTGAATYTLPTAALLVAAIPGAKVGDHFFFQINNTSSSGTKTITVAAGSGGTADGTLTVADNVCRLFRVMITNVTASSEAYTVIGMG